MRQGSRSFVATDDGAVVGFALAVFTEYGMPSETSGIIEQLVVDEAHRGTDVGRALVDACMAWLIEEGIPTVFVSTRAGSGADGFYERCGFTRCRGPWLVRSAA